MRRIIHNEFSINGYQMLKEEEGIAYYKNSMFDDFWIACYKPFLLENQSDLYEHYLALFATEYPTIKKNTSIVIIESGSPKSIEEIVAIENDPYLFKKYYISYNERAVEDLMALLTKDDKTMRSIEELMVKPETFTAMKNETEDVVYHLLYSIAHKLPFLPVEVNHEEVASTELQIDDEQRNCLEWCMGLSDDVDVRRTQIIQFSK